MQRQWRSLQRRSHRSLLAKLRGATQPPITALQAHTIVANADAQPWLSGLYGALVAAKRRRELAQAADIVPPIETSDVGNFTFGATGKTPCVLLLTELALRHARRGDRRQHDRVPMLLTRGYGDDEWRQFAATFPSCQLAVGADRLRVGQQRARELGGRATLSCVVLDDGLQQWRIRKDLEVVMVDALHPFGNGLLLPHGSLREMPSDALARADIVVIHHADLLHSTEALTALKAALLACASAGSQPATPRVVEAPKTGNRTTMKGASRPLPVLATSRLRVKRVVRVLDMRTRVAWDVDAPSEADEDTEGDNGDDAERTVPGRPEPETERWLAEFKGKVALVVCGVGNPASVQLVVEGMGCWHEVHTESFPDHHAFSRSDVDDMAQQAAELARTTEREVVVLTTEKDFYRSEALLVELVAANASVADVRVLQCELELVENARRVQAMVNEVLDRGAKCHV